MASSDTIIRNIYRQVTGQEADDTVIRAARGVPDSDLEQFFAEGGVQQFMTSPDAQIDSIRNVVLEAFKPFEEASERAGRFEEENPFTFDEALARQSAEERFDPFYDAELGDYVSGIDRARSRTVQDEQRLRRELTTETDQFVGRTRQQIDDAIEGSKEGFAGAGLFFSGERLKREGRIEQAGEQDISDQLRRQRLGLEESQLRQERTLTDLGADERTARRKTGAARETDILTDVEQQRGEALKRREFQRQQFVGFPLATGSSSIRSLLGA